MKKAILIIIALLIITGCTPPEEPVVRESAVAGSWYPGTEQEIQNAISRYYEQVEQEQIEGDIKALIVPHAGWRFSGQVAASGFKQLEDRSYDTVILMGPSHRALFAGASIPNATHYSTPLGLVLLSVKAKMLLQEMDFLSHETAHNEEHCLEIELPFLQHTLGDFKLIPIIIGPETDYEQMVRIAHSIKGIMDDSTLLVISSDFTHYGPNYGYTPFIENIEQNIKVLDSTAIEAIKNKDSKGFSDFVSQLGVTICGRNPITILLSMIEGTNTQVKELMYDTSGRQMDDFTNSVSYVSIVFYEAEEKGLTAEQKQYLLELARETVTTHVTTGQVPQQEPPDERLQRVQGCFVTLNKHGALRGCIGHILPQAPLYQCIIINGANAATRDTRFAPVTPDELEAIEIEVSVLSVPEELAFDSPDELKDRLRPLVDGVVLTYQNRQSTYLPQVWEQLPDKELFLSSLCQKQGSPADCWQQPDVRIDTYQANVFHESG